MTVQNFFLDKQIFTIIKYIKYIYIYYFINKKNVMHSYLKYKITIRNVRIKTDSSDITFFLQSNNFIRA